MKLSGLWRVIVDFLQSPRFYNLWRTPKLQPSMIKSIWKEDIPKKVKVFLWSLTHRSLNSHDRLQKRCPKWMISPFVCCLCLGNAESFDHLFIHCSFTMKGWHFLFELFGLYGCLPRHIEE